MICVVRQRFCSPTNVDGATYTNTVWPELKNCEALILSSDLFLSPSPGSDFQFFHLCSIYASFLPVRVLPQFVFPAHKSPTSSNPKPSPSCPPPPACALPSPVFICQLSANPCPTPPRRHFYLFSRALQNNHPHPASHICACACIFDICLFLTSSSRRVFSLCLFRVSSAAVPE